VAKARRTRKEPARELFYKPLGLYFSVIGAVQSDALGRCFVVIDGERERTFQASGFEIAAIDGTILWDELAPREAKRLKWKRTREKGLARKERDRLRQTQDDYEAAPDEDLEQSADESADDDSTESETIAREDTTGSESYDAQLEIALAAEAALEVEDEE
jgi:hypothetical protein